MSEDANYLAICDRAAAGGDLHDSIGQQLTGMILLAQVLFESARNIKSPEEHINRSDITEVSQRLSDQAARLRSGLEDALGDIRNVCRDLVTVPINDEGLVAALDHLVEKASTQSVVTCKFYCPVPITSPNPVTATHLFNIVQHGLPGVNEVSYRLSRGGVWSSVAATRSMGISACATRFAFQRIPKITWHDSNHGLGGIQISVSRRKSSGSAS